MGSNDLSVASYAACIAKEYSFKHIICSGGVAHTNDLLNTGWDKSEADMFADVMEKAELATPKVIREAEAKNTGDNIQLSRKVLNKKNKTIKTGLLVQKPFMLRRAMATAQKQWPEVTWKAISQPISYEDYVADKNEENLINIIVGDTQRHILYAEQGFQTPQEMSQNVIDAMNDLIKHGFTKHLPK